MHQSFILFLEHLEIWRRRNEIYLLAYVIMPNHVHLVLYPENPINMGRSIGQFKSLFAYNVILGWKTIRHPILKQLHIKRGGKKKFAFWQEGCYDHNCRTPDAVMEKIRYCHNNPVRANLVKNLEDWPWSSYQTYFRNQVSIVKLDGLELL